MIGSQNKIALRPKAAPLSGGVLFGLLLGVMLITLGGVWLTPIPLMRLGLGVFGSIVAMAILVRLASVLWTSNRDRFVRSTLGELVENSQFPAYLTDSDGMILCRNAAAEALSETDPDAITTAFADLFANPPAVLFRLQSKAQAIGACKEEIVTRRGQVRLTVQQVAQRYYLWHREELEERQAPKVESATLPMVTVGPSGTVLFMNEPFRRLVGGRIKAIDRVFHDLPVRSGRMNTVNAVDGPIQCLVAAIPGFGGRQEIYLLPGNEGVSNLPLSASWDSIEELPVPLLKVAGTGEVLASNREARQLLGNPAEVGTRLSDLLEGLGRPIVDWLGEVIGGKTVASRQFLRGKGEQQDFFVQVSLNVASGPEGPYLIAVLNDMTEFKSLEAQFVQSQKMQAIGQLAGGVAHDFNNLLTAISGHCDLLLLRHDQGDQDFADLIQIHQNANRAASLVGQLLAFSRKQTLKPEILDLRDTLSDLTHLLNRLVGERVTLVLNHDPGLLPIRADKRQLEQVIMNLVVNSRDAMPGGGEIRIETENLDLPLSIERDRVRLPAGPYVLVRIIDEGHGIPPEKIGKIFEPFYTTKRTGEGTGLGLSTAYGIVKQTGGFIFVDSEVGTGTVFNLYFPSYIHKPEVEEVPVVDKPAVKQINALAQPVPRAGDGIVLLVEDEAPVRAFASRALKLRGYTVLEADCAENALKLLEDPDIQVDVFVTDAIMPGKDGPTWVKEALVQRPSTNVVFVSGYAEDAFGEDQEAIPNSVFLPKPFSLGDLTQTVQSQLQVAG